MVNIYVCDYTDSEGINTIIAIQQESHEEYIDYFKELLDKKMIERIDDIETLIEALDMIQLHMLLDAYVVTK